MTPEPRNLPSPSALLRLHRFLFRGWVPRAMPLFNWGPIIGWFIYCWLGPFQALDSPSWYDFTVMFVPIFSWIILFEYARQLLWRASVALVGKSAALGDRFASFELGMTMTIESQRPKEFDDYIRLPTNVWVQPQEDGSIRQLGSSPDDDTSMSERTFRRVFRRGTKYHEKCLASAIKAFTQAQGNDEIGVQAHYWLALIQLRGISSGSLEEARDHLRIAANRGLVTAKFELALTLLRTDDMDPHAFNLLEEVNSELPDGASHWVTKMELARMLSNRGMSDSEQALKLLESVIAIGVADDESASIMRHVQLNPSLAASMVMRKEAMRMTRQIMDGKRIHEEKEKRKRPPTPPCHPAQF